MALSDTTRLLVLGVVQIFEPANGYQLRQELISWDVEEWAHINPGSVYSMLSTLTKQEMIERIDLEVSPGARPVAVYRMTSAGVDELLVLLRRAIVTVHPFDRTEFYAAMSMAIGLLDRDETRDRLHQRRKTLKLSIESQRQQMIAIAADPGTPPHVAPLMGYSVAQSESEREWLAGFIASIERGEMVFRGEAMLAGWKPADGDPAWRMIHEQSVYRAKLEELDRRP